jgi:putative MATE family efflux protein
VHRPSEGPHLSPNVTASPRKLTLLALAWPLFVEQGLRALVSTVDTFMVSHVSDGAVAALGQASQVLILSLIVFNFVGMGSSVVVTHHLGAGDRAGADRIAAAAIAVNTWLGLAVSLVVVSGAGPMLRLMQLPEPLMPLAMQFLPLMGGTLFLEAQSTAMSAVLRAHGHTREPMWVAVGQNVLNAAGNALLLFGLFGLPRLGVTGVALSGVVSRIVSCAAFWFLLRRRIGFRARLRDYIAVPRREVRRILHIGLPAAGENLCWWLALIVVTAFIARMGPTALATRSYVMQVALWVIIFGVSVGLATEILVGHRVGAGQLDEAYHELLRSLRTALVLVSCAVVPIAIFAPQILGLFTRDPVIISGGALLLRLGLVLEPGRVFNIVVISSLRATGDARFPLKMGIASMWGIWVPLAWLLGLELGLGLPGVWLAMMADEWFRGIIMYVRWRRRRWVAHAEQSRARVDVSWVDLAAG